MTNEETNLYKIYVDSKPAVPTLRIEWKQKEDYLPKFIASLDEYNREKIYDYMRNYIMAMEATGGNQIHNFYAEYNNEKGIKQLEELL